MPATCSIETVLVRAQPWMMSMGLSEWLTDRESLDFGCLPPRRRAHWLAGRIALKRAYRQARGGYQFSEIDVSHDSMGRPTILGAALYCSIAHAGGYALGAVGQVLLGADLEPARRWGQAVAQQAACVQELELVAAAGICGAQVPTVTWAIKESVLKAMGTGLAIHPRRVMIMGRSADGWIVHAADGLAAEGTWQVVTTLCGEAWVAIAHLPGAHPVRFTIWPCIRSSRPETAPAGHVASENGTGRGGGE